MCPNKQMDTIETMIYQGISTYQILFWRFLYTICQVKTKVWILKISSIPKYSLRSNYPTHRNTTPNFKGLSLYSSRSSLEYFYDDIYLVHVPLGWLKYCRIHMWYTSGIRFKRFISVSVTIDYR